jgi:glycosyltransferase involved in cell wall biosynthesis
VRILVIQVVRLGHFLAASRAAEARYPGAKLVGLVRGADLPEARAYFAEVHPLPPDLDPSLRSVIGGPLPDICVVPFEDRFGIRYWNVRLVPIRLGIPNVLSYNGHGQVQEWSRAGWLANSIMACVGLRAVHVLYSAARQAWGWVRRRLDVAGLFALAGIGLALRRLQAIGLYPLSGHLRRRLSPGPCRLVLFIPSLGLGGAQRQLASYLQNLDRTKWEPEVVTLDTLDKFFEPEIRRLEVPITFLNPHCRFATLGVLRQLVGYLYRSPCQVLHSWLHYAVALGAIAGTLVGVPTIVGSLRSGRPGRFPWFYPKWQRWIDILTVPLHTRLIANSATVREENREWAFIPEHKLLTVYNGINQDLLSRLSKDEKRRLRTELGLSSMAAVVGIVGRLFPEKDHKTFLQAAAIVSRAKPTTQFLIIGEGSLYEEIQSEIVRLGLAGHVLMLGGRKDALALIQLLDVFVLTSRTEGFPNVLLEAAALEVPVVTTAAGGACEVVVDGVTGFVVPCGDAELVAARILVCLNATGLARRLAEAARERVGQWFAADRVAAQIQATYDLAEAERDREAGKAANQLTISGSL